MGRLISACLLFFLPVVCFSKATPELKSTVRVIEGVVAPDWEARFLPPEPPATVTPPRESSDADILKDAVPPAVRKNKATAPIKNGRRPTAEIAQPDPAAGSPGPLPEKEEMPRPRAVEKIVKDPAPPYRERKPQVAVPPASKIDKEGETGDDSVEKRKKERRDTLREERKDRNYRNRRIE